LLGGHAPLNAFEPRYTGFSPAPLFPIPGFPTSFSENSDVEADAYSLLFLDRISFSDKLILAFGGRAEWFSAEQSFLYPDAVPLTSSRNSQDPTNFNPMVGLVVKPLPELSLYANYTEATSSFRNIGLATASGEALDPERARQYEGGIKAEFFKGRLALTTAVFQIDKTNVSSPDPANPLFNINAGDERSRGVEFDIYSEPLQGWKFYSNYAYVDARITNDPLGLNTGNRRYGVPFHSGSVFSTYELQAGPLRGLGVGGGVFMASNVDITNAAVGTLPGYAQVDGLLYYRRGPWRIQFNAKNLLDKDYFFTSGDGATVQPATARTLIGSIQFFF
jgi:iron complex outermembrane receptor protein